MLQLLCHLFGDYILQNDHVGVRKKEKSKTGLLYCIYHCITYGLVFLLVTNWQGALLIAIGHFIIDRWNIIGYFIALKNNVYNDKGKLDVTNFGCPLSRPFAITIWLYIIQDNIIHLIFNYFVICII